jgi:hypothetical protein
VPQEIAQSVVLMALKKQFFLLRSTLKTKPAPFGCIHLQDFLPWHCNYISTPFVWLGAVDPNRATSIFTETMRGAPKPFVKEVVLGTDTDPLVEGPDFSVCQQLSLQ